jgi:hypothetical protein
MLCRVSDVRGWHVERDIWPSSADPQESPAIAGSHGENWGTIRRLEANWRVFEAGGHKSPTGKLRRKDDLQKRESSSGDDERR